MQGEHTLCQQACPTSHGRRYSNCSATGTIETNNVIYIQDFYVTFTMACGSNRTDTWRNQLTMNGATQLSTTTMNVVYTP